MMKTSSSGKILTKKADAPEGAAAAASRSCVGHDPGKLFFEDAPAMPQAQEVAGRLSRRRPPCQAMLVALDAPLRVPMRAPEGRGVAQPGSASHWGCGGRWFESSRPDHYSRDMRGMVPKNGSPTDVAIRQPHRNRCYSRDTLASRRPARTSRWPRRIALAILAIPALYLLAALVGSLIPVNSDWEEPAGRNHHLPRQ